VDHGAVVGHAHDEGVLGDAQLGELVHQLADVAIEAIERPGDTGRVQRLGRLRRCDEAQQVGPVAGEEGLFRVRVALDELVQPLEGTEHIPSDERSNRAPGGL
jgi:hypothetical protein